MPENMERNLESLEDEVHQLRTALQSRIVIEQAKGVMSVVLDIPVEEAFEVLRLQARSERRLLYDVAAEVVDSRGGCLSEWTRLPKST